MTLLRRSVAFLALALALAAAAGCTTDDTLRFDGATPDAGQAIARNSALQIIDPSPPGSAHTRLSVPAQRPPPLTVTDASVTRESPSGVAGPGS
ncbi:MAG TPA: hypothetical protein VGN97_03450 [Mesorhizobium sp.]|jgi:hypothetical protein|nr:hypothetical protein [Mesorhizobium sp.]